MLTAEELTDHLEACKANNRASQKMIYSSFYGYAMAICDRYTNKQDDAVEILNDGFLKVFKEVHRFTPTYSDITMSFKGWIRKIMVYTAIDHYRRNNKNALVSSIESVMYHVPSVNDDAIHKLSYDEIIRAIQVLSPGYRTVLNLYIIEGFTHEEISNQLGISVGTSKSNLSKARKQLQTILFKQNKIVLTKNAI